MSSRVIPIKAATKTVPLVGEIRRDETHWIDSRGRPLRDVRISITDRCNFRCRYCMPDGGIEKCAHEDICSLEGLRDMAAAAVRCGVKKTTASFPTLKSSLLRKSFVLPKSLPRTASKRFV